MNKEQANALLKKTLGFSKTGQCMVSLFSSQTGIIQYAGNQLTKSSFILQTSLTISVTLNGHKASVATNHLEDPALADAVRRAEELAAIAPPDREAVDLPGPQIYPGAPKGYDPLFEGIDPAFRSLFVERSFQAAAAARLVSSGRLLHRTSVSALANSKGLFAYDQKTLIDTIVRMKDEAGTVQSAVHQCFNDLEGFKKTPFIDKAVDRAIQFPQIRAMEPGKYTVILEPAAALPLVMEMMDQMDRRAAEEGRSFLSTRAAKKTRLGEQLLGEKVTIYSDPEFEAMPTRPWDADGLPQKKTLWIENGVIKNIPVSRYWATQLNIEPIPRPESFIMNGGSRSVSDLVEGVEKGILVTKLRALRMVDQQTVLMTGLTTEGLYYIEDGKIRYRLKNFRFNESPIIMLNNLQDMGVPQRVVNDDTGREAFLPALKIAAFTFTALAEGI